MAAITLTSLTKRYENRSEFALAGLSLEIRDGEFVALLGPSGCGKSTTLRLIAGLEHATEGTIHIGDREMNDVAPKDRDVAMVFQNYALYPHMSVFDNMAFALRLRCHRIEDIATRITNVASSLGIAHLLQRYPRELSGGEQQRVALGRAMVRAPSVFLFDEPLSNLDPARRKSARIELRRVQRRLGVTSVIVTHDQEEAMTMGDRVAVLSQGVLMQFAAPMELYHNPANRFVASFLGTPAMNLIEGRLIEKAGQLYLVRPGFELRLPQQDHPVLQARRDTELVVGVRAETVTTIADDLDKQAADHRAYESASVSFTLDVCEPLGSHVDLCGHVGDDIPFIARLPQSLTPRTQQNEILLTIDTTQLHYFERGEYGRNLRHLDQ